MSRSVKKPHGLTIASGNSFFFRLGDTFETFPCVITFEQYSLGDATINTANCDIRTPASQLCWDMNAVPLPHTERNEWLTFWQPRPWFRLWLDENAPGWRTNPPKIGTFSEEAIFLTKRAHALAIADLVKKHLGCIPSRVHAPGE